MSHSVLEEWFDGKDRQFSIPHSVHDGDITEAEWKEVARERALKKVKKETRDDVDSALSVR